MIFRFDTVMNYRILIIGLDLNSARICRTSRAMNFGAGLPIRCELLASNLPRGFAMGILTRLSILLILLWVWVPCLFAQDDQPDSVSKINNAMFAYYQKKDQTQVIAGGVVIFDNHTSEFPVAKGAQTIKLYFMYEFPGKTLSEEPKSITLAFGSVAGLPARFARSDQRDFQLIVDGEEIIRAEAKIMANIPTPYVTYEDLAVVLSMSDVNRLLGARLTASMKIGGIRHSLSVEHLEGLRQFVDALRKKRMQIM
jgi:hypothetical protein